MGRIKHGQETVHPPHLRHRREADDFQRYREHATRDISPEWGSITVTQHAILRYVERVAEHPCKESSVIRKLKYVVLEGRRSDRDKGLLAEIQPWLLNVKLVHHDRPVTVFMNTRKVCCLCVKTNETENGLTILTCFLARDHHAVDRSSRQRREPPK